MENGLALGIAKAFVAGIGAILSGVVLYYVKRVADRKNDEAKQHALAHRRYERNFIRISEHSDVKLETEGQ